MGGLCTKADDTVTVPGAAGPFDPSNTAPANNAARGSMTGKTNSMRRESERKGLRHGLVHERKHMSVWDVYEVVKEIGHGMTGKVYQVKQKMTGEVYALKCMEMRRIDPELLDDLRNEIELLKMMDHPNVIKLYEYYEDQHNIYLILEFCDGGELFDRLHEQKGSRYSEAEAGRLMFKMCAAIGYCHYMGISHRDLKLENFIFESRESDSNIKLIDFGLSAKYGSPIRRMHTMVGTAYYIAPEVLNQADGGSSGYTNACDCWSLGVIAYMLLSGTPPFKGRRDREVLQAVRKGKYTLSGPKWEHVSDDAKDFIRHLLVYNPAKRMTAEQALKHAWLQRAKTETVARPLDPEILQNLRDFSKFSSFKRAALEAIAFSMSAQSIRHLREQFMKLDKDQSGFVSLAEFLDVVSSSGLSKEEGIRIFEGIDQDRTNNISYTEFLAASLSRRLWLSRERIKDAFQRLDVDSKGYITKENLKDLLGDDWTPQRVAIMMSEADTNGDGKIDFDEFLAVMTKESLDSWKDVLPSSASYVGLPTSISSSDLASLHMSGHDHGRTASPDMIMPSVLPVSSAYSMTGDSESTGTRGTPDFTLQPAVAQHSRPLAIKIDAKDPMPSSPATVPITIPVSPELNSHKSTVSVSKFSDNKMDRAPQSPPTSGTSLSPVPNTVAHDRLNGVISTNRTNSNSTNSVGRASAALAAGIRAAVNGTVAGTASEPLLLNGKKRLDVFDRPEHPPQEQVDDGVLVESSGAGTPHARSTVDAPGSSAIVPGAHGVVPPAPRVAMAAVGRQAK